MSTAVRLLLEEPTPLTPCRRASLDAYAAELRNNPGRWSLMGRRDTGGAARQWAYEVRTALRASFSPAGAFEADARTVCGEHRIYVRYVGATTTTTRSHA